MLTSAIPSAVHVPFRRIALCLDCEACFELGGERCPGCGSETWVVLAKFLERARNDRAGLTSHNAA
jgi:hypothetical protein